MVSDGGYADAGKIARAARLRVRSAVAKVSVKQTKRTRDKKRPGVGGRPVTSRPARVSDNFCTFLNEKLEYCTVEGVPDQSSGLYDKRRYYFNCDCGVFGHVTFRTMESVFKIDKKLSEEDGATYGIPCRICTGVCDSERERKVRQALVSVMGGRPYVYSVNDRIAGGNLSADFFLPEINLAIMVDGEGHTDTPMYGLTPEAQREIDDRFNVRARAYGYNVLRLHHDDIDHGCFAGKIKQGMVLSRKGRRGILLYSFSYMRLGVREEYTHASWYKY